MTLLQQAHGLFHAATSFPAQFAAAGAGLASSAIGWIVAQNPDVADKAIGTGKYAIVVAALSLIGKLASDGFAAWNQRRKDELANKLDMYKAETERRISELEFSQRQMGNTQVIAGRATEEEFGRIRGKVVGLARGQVQNSEQIGVLGAGTGIPVSPAIPPEGTGEQDTIPPGV